MRPLPYTAKGRAAPTTCDNAAAHERPPDVVWKCNNLRAANAGAQRPTSHDEYERIDNQVVGSESARRKRASYAIAVRRRSAVPRIRSCVSKVPSAISRRIARTFAARRLDWPITSAKARPKRDSSTVSSRASMESELEGGVLLPVAPPTGGDGKTPLMLMISLMSPRP